MKRNAIALLLTLLFMMLITVAIGIGMQQSNAAKKLVQQEQLMIQTGIMIDDVLKMLKSSQEFKAILEDESPASLYAFISSSGFLPFESGGYRVLLEIKSARDRWNINNLIDQAGKVEEKKVAVFEAFLAQYGIDGEFVAMLLDAMKNKPNSIYQTDLLDNNPQLLHGYIASSKHFETIANYYGKKYHEDLFLKLEFDKMLLFNKQKGTKIDLNYATPLTWQLLLGCSYERGLYLFNNSGWYESVDDLELSEEEKERLKLFATSFKEPVLWIKMRVEKDDMGVDVAFEYDIRTKKASRFVYEI